MSQLTGHVRDYLAMRRALGFKLGKEGRLLQDSAAFAEATPRRPHSRRVNRVTAAAVSAPAAASSSIATSARKRRATPV